MMNEEIGYILEMLSFKTSIYRDKYKRNLSFNDDEYYANVLNEYIEDLQQRIDKVDKYIDRLLNTDNPMYLDAVLITIREILGGKE